jgi:hypothetical protein
MERRNCSLYISFSQCVSPTLSVSVSLVLYLSLFPFTHTLSLSLRSETVQLGSQRIDENHQLRHTLLAVDTDLQTHRHRKKVFLCFLGYLFLSLSSVSLLLCLSRFLSLSFLSSAMSLPRVLPLSRCLSLSLWLSVSLRVSPLCWSLDLLPCL